MLRTEYEETWVRGEELKNSKMVREWITTKCKRATIAQACTCSARCRRKSDKYFLMATIERGFYLRRLEIFEITFNRTTVLFDRTSRVVERKET